MTYVVRKTDGLVAATIHDLTINDSATSLKLVGPGALGYGEALAEDLVRLLENFAHRQPPAHPMAGQLWFDTALDALKVFDGAAWEPVAPPATESPSGVAPGTYTAATITVNANGRITAARDTALGAVTRVETGAGLSGGPITGVGTLALAPSGVTAGTYAAPTVTVDVHGRVTAAQAGTMVTRIDTGGGLTGGPITSTGTIALAATGVASGTYTHPTITVDAKGRITAAQSGSVRGFQGVSVYRNSQWNFPAGSNVMVPFETVAVDSDGFWTAGAPTRLTVPMGVTKVQLTGQAYIAVSPAGYGAYSPGAVYGVPMIRIYKNGTEFVCDQRSVFIRGTADGSALNVTTPVLSVVAGDVFEFSVMAWFTNNTITGDGYASVAALPGLGATGLSLTVLG